MYSTSKSPEIRQAVFYNSFPFLSVFAFRQSTCALFSDVLSDLSHLTLPMTFFMK